MADSRPEYRLVNPASPCDLRLFSISANEEDHASDEEESGAGVGGRVARWPLPLRALLESRLELGDLILLGM